VGGGGMVNGGKGEVAANWENQGVALFKTQGSQNRRGRGFYLRSGGDNNDRWEEAKKIRAWGGGGESGRAKKKIGKKKTLGIRDFTKRLP